ncbi:MAG TPA: sugar dehydrogenase complex small subunit [Bauldia sp.]|nr:sugar dehydrogenase complex small subunit [Bauldia sp.]
MTSAVSRRDLILAGAAAAITSVGAAGFPSALFAQAAVTVEAFVGLSEKLTGAKDLDAGVAKTLLGGFLATGNGAALAAMVADEAAFTSHTDLANAIVAAWYSGVYETGKGEAVADFAGALVWTALDFTKPWAECGGTTGYWAEAPGT